jgi:hypothetical protein
VTACPRAGGYFYASMLDSPAVTILCAGQATIVEMRQLPMSRREGFACLADLWRLARKPGALDDFVFDFVGKDGFRSSKKCGARLRGSALLRGFVDRRRLDLDWDALDLPCSFFVKGVATIVADRVSESDALLVRWDGVRKRAACVCGHARHG